jgi:hypothetical protein
MTMKTNPIGRRSVIAGAAAAAGLAAFAGPARAARLGIGSTGATGNRALAVGGADDWRRALGTVFAADTDSGRVALKLVAVESLASGPARPAGLPRDHGFALSFDTLGARLPVGNRPYRLSSAAFHPVHVLFSSGTERLTAIFN